MRLSHTSHNLPPAPDELSLEALAVYLQAHPTSPFAINLKACNHYKLYNGKAAEAELKTLTDVGYSFDADHVLRHNTVVFRGGEGALIHLPPFIDTVPESRLNLAIFHLKSGRLGDAAAILVQLEPTTVPEYVLKGTILVALGQAVLLGKVGGSDKAAATATTLLQGASPRDALKQAQAYFQIVGASPSECDTIPGRQAMALCFFLKRQFEDVRAP